MRTFPIKGAADIEALTRFMRPILRRTLAGQSPDVYLSRLSDACHQFKLELEKQGVSGLDAVEAAHTLMRRVSRDLLEDLDRARARRSLPGWIRALSGGRR